MLLSAIKEITKDMGLYGLSSILGQAISLLLLPLYTQYLSPSDYGIFSLVGIAVSGYNIFSNLGISSAIFRFVGTSSSEQEQNKYLNNAQILNIVANAFFLVLFLALAYPLAYLFFGEEEKVSFIYFIIISGTVGSISSVFISFIRVKRLTKKIALGSLINLIVSVILTFVLLVGLNWGIWGALVGGLIGSISTFFFYTKYVSKLQIKEKDFSKMKELMNFALPVLPHKVLSFALPILSQLVLLRFLTLDVLGFYNIAFKFCLPLVLFINLFQRAYYPFRFEIYKNNSIDNKGLFSKINLLFSALILTFFSATVLFGKPVLTLFTAKEFHQAALYIPYLALTPLIQGFYYSFGTGVEFSKSPRFLPLMSAVGSIVIIVFSILLIPKYEIIGAALANVSGWLIMMIINYFYAQSIYPINYSLYRFFFLLIPPISIYSLVTALDLDSNLFISTFLLILQLALYYLIMKSEISEFLTKNAVKSEI